MYLRETISALVDAHIIIHLRRSILLRFNLYVYDDDGYFINRVTILF